MKKQIFIITFYCSIMSIGLIATLKLNKRELHKKINHFNRNISSDFASNFQYMDIKFNSYYIAGLSPDKIFLGNSTAPAHMLATDYLFKDTLFMNVKNPNSYHINWNLVNVYCNFPDIYFFEKNSPNVLYRKYPSQQIVNNHTLNNIQYDTKIVPISPDIFALRVYDTLLQQNTLVIKKKDSLQLLTSSAPILKKQVDGNFCTDGMLLYSSHMDKLVYLYYYRNEFMCVDTNMNLIYSARTIDTISKANIKLDTIHSEGRITFSVPPVRVNVRSCLFKDKLFVHSNLIADNDEIKSFKQNSVIDVYDLKKGEYEFSFYIPYFKKNKMRQFKVFDNKMVVIYDHYLATFDLGQI